MTRYFALLRAINVGGHLVKMDRLRNVFESMGFSNVETFNEIYWLRRGKHSESTISNAAFGKVIGGPATVRGSNTVNRLVAKYTRGEDQTITQPLYG